MMMSLTGIGAGAGGALTGYVLAGFLAAVMFGVGFNWVVNHLRAAKVMDYLVGPCVMVGVAGTVAIGYLFGLISQDELIVLVVLFAGSGLPMVAGQLVPVIRERKEEQERLRGGDKI